MKVTLTKAEAVETALATFGSFEALIAELASKAQEFSDGFAGIGSPQAAHYTTRAVTLSACADTLARISQKP